MVSESAAPLLSVRSSFDIESGPAKGGASDGGESHEKTVGFGKKTIGWFGSMCLLYGNITGPGMVQIPGLFQSAGWVVPTLLFFIFSWLAGVVSLYLAKAISLLPGNRRFGERIEFNEIARAAFPYWAYLATMVLIIFNLMASNTSAVVVSAQTMDATLLAAVGRTCGIYLYPLRAPGCISRGDVPSGQNSAFGGDYVISLGWAVVLTVTIPLGLLNLDDNIYMQVAGFVLLSATIAVWSVQFIFYSGLSLARTAAFDASGLAGALSTIAFNYGLILTVPSWLAEKGSTVRVNRTIWLALIVGTVQFLALGLLGAWALDFSGGNDVLAVLTDPSTPHVLIASKIGAFVLPLAALLTGIPIYSIIIRYNLLQIGVPILPANIFAVGLPWGLSLIFFAGNQLADLITWSSALIAVILNFVLPVVLYIIVMRADQSHDAAILRATNEKMGEGAVGGSINDAATGAGAAAVSPPRQGWRRLLSGMFFPSPSVVDLRLEALDKAHREDAHLSNAQGRLANAEHAASLAPLFEALADDSVAAQRAGQHHHHAGEALRLTPPTDGERDEVEDGELVPLLSCCINPVTLAYAVAGFSLVLNFATLALQILQSVSP